MRILYIENNPFWDPYVKESFLQLGQEIMTFAFPQKIETEEFVILSETNRTALVETLQKREYDLVFSLSYYHEVSVFCNILGVYYVSWIFQYPNWDLMRESRHNDCNIFFFSDSSRVESFLQQGIEKTFYLPAAARGVEIHAENEHKEEDKEKDYKVSFVGKIPVISPDSPFGENSTLSPQGRGYLDGLVHCQRVTYGLDLLSAGAPVHVINELMLKYPLQISEEIKDNVWKLYLQKYLWNQVTRQEKLVLFQQLSGALTVFSGQEKEENTNYDIKEYPKDWAEWQKVVTESQVNLVIADRFHQNAIPWEVFEIMSMKGLVLSNYQNDMKYHFVGDEDYIYYEDLIDLQRKTAMLLNDEEKREKLCQSAYDKVKKEHLMIHRIKEMLDILG